MRIIIIVITFLFIRTGFVYSQTPLPDCAAAIFDTGTTLVCQYYYPDPSWVLPIPPSDQRVIVYWGEGDARNFNGELTSFLNIWGGWSIIKPDVPTQPNYRPEGGLLVILDGNVCKYKYNGPDADNDHVFVLDEEIEFSLFDGISNQCTEENFTCLFDYLVPETKSYFHNKYNCKVWSGECGGDLYGNGLTGTMMIGTDIVSMPEIWSTVTKGIIADRARIFPLPWSINCFSVAQSADSSLYDLDKLQSFIKENGHLPGTPSGEEIEAAGDIDIHAVNLDQQEKIEMLYKHVSDLENKIEVAKRNRN